MRNCELGRKATARQDQAGKASALSVLLPNQELPSVPPFSEWSDDDFAVLADYAVVGGINGGCCGTGRRPEGACARNGVNHDVQGRRPTLEVSRWPSTGEVEGRRDMATLLGDFLLFSCLAVWASGMVIAIASLLS